MSKATRTRRNTVLPNSSFQYQQQLYQQSGHFFALKRTQSYLRKAQGEERLSLLSLPVIEIRFLATSTSKLTFFGDVIGIFVTISKGS